MTIRSILLSGLIFFVAFRYGCTSTAEYLGCYADNVNQPVFSAPDEVSANMTNNICLQHCSSESMVFAVTCGKSCFCGVNFAKYGKRPEIECNEPCPGNVNEMCGDTSTSDQQRLSAYLIVAPLPYPDCGVDGEPVGFENGGKQRGSKITSNVSLTPAHVRLNSKRNHGNGWSFDADNWLQLEFRQISSVSGVVTQGAHYDRKWVKLFQVKFSIRSDGNTWQYALSKNKTVFTGHNEHNKNVPLINPFDAILRTLYIRFIPLECEWYCNLRVEALVIEPLGMESGVITDDSLTSTLHNDSDIVKHGPANARLNSGEGCWMPEDNGDSVIVDLRAQTVVRQIAVQGCADLVGSTPESFNVMYGLTEIPDTNYTDVHGNFQDFTVAANDSNDVVIITLPIPIFARSVSISPLRNSNNTVGLRIELYGFRKAKTSCYEWLKQGYHGNLVYWTDKDGRLKPDKSVPVLCHGNIYPLGMMTGDIKSNYLNSGPGNDTQSPDFGRLHYEDSPGQPAAWTPKDSNPNAFIQISTRYYTVFRMLATQGQMSAWVTRFYMQYGPDNENLQYYLANTGEKKLFIGNSDGYSVVEHDVGALRMVRFVKILAMSWESKIALRLEIYGEYLNHPDYNENILLRYKDLDGYITTQDPADTDTAFLLLDDDPNPILSHGHCMNSTETKDNYVQVVIGSGSYKIVSITVVTVENETPEDLTASVSSSDDIGDDDICEYQDSLNTNALDFLCHRNKVQYIAGNGVRISIKDKNKKALQICELYAFEYYDSDEHANNEDCLEPIGLESGYIDDSELRGSTSMENFEAHYGRLFQPHGHAWSPAIDDENPYLEIDLRAITRIRKVAIQIWGNASITDGGANTNWSFSLNFSVYGFNFNDYDDNDDSMVHTFSGNFHRGIVYTILDPAIEARLIRILPLTSSMALRVELYGCRKSLPTCKHWYNSGCIKSAWYWLGSDDEEPVSEFCSFVKDPSGVDIILNYLETKENNRPSSDEANKAIDGDNQTCMTTQESRSPWWYVTLEQEYELSEIILYNEYSDTCLSAKVLKDTCRSSFLDVSIKIGTTTSTPDNAQNGYCVQRLDESVLEQPDGIHVICSSPIVGNYINVSLDTVSQNSYLKLCEVDAVAIDVYGTCSEDLGVCSHDITADQLTCSSVTAKADNGRFDIGCGAWCTTTDTSTWFQVDFRGLTFVTMIGIQDKAPSCLSSFYLSQSNNGHNFTRVKDAFGEDQLYTGKIVDKATTAHVRLPQQIVTRYLRFEPFTGREDCCLRVEFYGCRRGLSSCKDWLSDEFFAGDDVMYWIGSDDILDAHYCCSDASVFKMSNESIVPELSASTFRDEDHSPVHARNHRGSPIYVSYGHQGTDKSYSIVRLCVNVPGMKCWSPANTTVDPEPWLQLELPAVTLVTHIETFGGLEDRVTEYKLSYSENGKDFTWYSERGQEKVLYANPYPMQTHEYQLERPLTARYIRFYPVDWENGICLAVDLSGCFKGSIKDSCDELIAEGYPSNWYWIGTRDNYTSQYCGDGQASWIEPPEVGYGRINDEHEVVQLYNIPGDQEERVNLASCRPDIVYRLLQRLRFHYDKSVLPVDLEPELKQSDPFVHFNVMVAMAIMLLVLNRI